VKSNSYHLSILFKSKVEKEREKVMGGTSSQNGLVGWWLSRKKNGEENTTTTVGRVGGVRG